MNWKNTLSPIRFALEASISSQIILLHFDSIFNGNAYRVEIQFFNYSAKLQVDVTFFIILTFFLDPEMIFIIINCPNAHINSIFLCHFWKKKIRNVRNDGGFVWRAVKCIFTFCSNLKNQGMTKRLRIIIGSAQSVIIVLINVLSVL